MDIERKLLNLAQRRSDVSLTQDISLEDFNKSIIYESTRNFSALSEKQRIEKYLIDSMAPVPKRSTDISIEEGERIKKHLENELPNYGLDVEFRYQGSVINNTHIVWKSDIDLLVITKKFETLEKPQVPKNPYNGNVIEDLVELRARCIEILKNSYSVADITKGSKSITISGGSLRRDIDVVPSNWFNSNDYANTGLEYFRSIYILDNEKKERNKNLPFYNKKLMEEKDNETNGLYKGLVRLAKNIRCDADEKVVQDISSYDIQALFYNMPSESFCNLKGLDIVPVATKYLENLVNNESSFNTLIVPDKTRKIVEKMSYEQLILLFSEFSSYNEILAHNTVRTAMNTMFL